MKKYKLVQLGSDYIFGKHIGRYRLIALRSFSDVREGDGGGIVFDESNLSHDGDCWIYPGAHVLEGVRVSGDSRVMNGTWLRGDMVVRNVAVIEDCVIMSQKQLAQHLFHEFINRGKNGKI